MLKITMNNCEFNRQGKAGIRLLDSVETELDLQNTTFNDQPIAIDVYSSTAIDILGLPPGFSEKTYLQLIEAIREFGKENFQEVANLIQTSSPEARVGVADSALTERGWSFLADTISIGQFFVQLASNAAATGLIDQLWK